MNNSIILNEDCLYDDFLPPQVQGRDFQVKWLMSALFPAVRGRKPIHVWVHGKPGSGKTCTCRYVLRKLRQRWGESAVGALYINCARYSTLYSILDAALKELRLLGAESPNTTFKLERFLDFIKKKPFIVILDEIDFPSPKERNNILYNLARNGNIGIICISQCDKTYHCLDQRVRSRLSARTLEFQPYAIEQILKILEDRAKASLKPGSWNNAVLSNVAGVAQGDARVAIEMLKGAAEHAESKGQKLDAEHLHDISKEAKGVETHHALGKLTEHHRIIYRIIENKPDINSGDLWKAYEDFCKHAGFQTLARRTFSAYVMALENLNLVHSEKLAVKGKVKRFRVE